MKKTLTILIPCKDEEQGLPVTFQTITRVNEALGYELDYIIVNDGSLDNTLDVARLLEKEYKNIQIVKHKEPKGLGMSFVKGSIMAKGEYFAYFPGDNQITEEYMVSLLSQLGKADLILSYPENRNIRPLNRRIFSNLFTSIYNILFKMNLKYYNGPAVFRTNLLLDIDLVSRFFSYHAEAVTRYLKKGYSYVEVGGKLRDRETGESKALNFYNFVGVLVGTICLFLDVYLMRRDVYNKKGCPHRT